MNIPKPPLFVITDRHQAAASLDVVAAAAFAAGCRWLSVREKDLPAAERRLLLARIVALGRGFGATVGIHGDIDAVRAVRADALHLPSGESLQEARRRVGPRVLIGQSVHDEAGVELAAQEGADYVTISPIFSSPGKPGYGPALGLGTLARIAASTSLPIVALGGITPETAALCRAAGAAGVAVMGSVMRAEDPEIATMALLGSLASAR